MGSMLSLPGTIAIVVVVRYLLTTSQQSGSTFMDQGYQTTSHGQSQVHVAVRKLRTARLFTAQVRQGAISAGKLYKLRRALDVNNPKSDRLGLTAKKQVSCTIGARRFDPECISQCMVVSTCEYAVSTRAMIEGWLLFPFSISIVPNLDYQEVTIRFSGIDGYI